MYFARYMEENGIEPVVITVDPEKAAYPAYDHSLSEKVKHVRVIHTSPGFSLFKAYSFVKSGKTKAVVPVGDVGSRKKTWFDKFSAYIRANYFIPDARVGWNKQVIPVAAGLLSKEKFDWVITTGPPHSTHLNALALRRQFAFHWLADFRDPWHEIYYNEIFKRTERADRKDLQLEREVLDKADTVLTVGPSMKSLLGRIGPGIDEKTFFIYNGYDSDLFEGLSSKRYPEFTIAHIGVWTNRQPSAEIVSGLKMLLKENPGKKIRFVTAGPVDEDILSQLKQVEGLVTDHRGRVPHREALQEMMNADLLLNNLSLMDKARILISGKLMEYIASGNHILVVGDREGDAARLLDPVENARVVSPGDQESMNEALRFFIRQERAEKNHSDFIRQYSRKSTAAQLVKLLNSRV